MAAENQQHSDWLQQEAELLMDELFVEMQDDLESGEIAARFVSTANDSLKLTPPSTPLALSEDHAWEEFDEPDLAQRNPWVPEAKTPPFYQRLFLILGGLAVVTPISLWGSSALQKAAQQKSVIAATPAQATNEPSAADKEFAKYAERAVQKISAKPKAEPTPKSPSAVGATSLPPLAIQNIPSVLPPIAASNAGTLETLPPPIPAPPAQSPERGNLAASAPSQPLALKVLPSNANPTAPALPPVPSSVEQTSQTQAATAPSSTANDSSSITAAPPIGLPSLSADIPEPLGSNSVSTIAAATPLSSPKNASRKVIGIIELGLQSTLMVSNNGSHLNFKVGDIVSDEGWKLAQITGGKAVLQKGTEYKTLSEGQLF